jgi:polyferredoxin
MKPLKSAIKKQARDINREVRNKLVGYIVAGFGLVAGLAWNDAIRSFIEYVFPLKENSVVAKLIYAVIITLLVVFISIYIAKILKDEEGEAVANNKKGVKK